jgi:hypothetical protein
MRFLSQLAGHGIKPSFEISALRIDPAAVFPLESGGS